MFWDLCVFDGLFSYIRKTMYTFNKSNIELLNSLLIEADFHIRDIPGEVEHGEATFNLRRPYWERPIRKRWLWIKKTLVKEVFSQLVFEGLIEIEVIQKEDIYNEPHDHHSIFNIEYRRKEGVLWLDMAYFELNFHLKPDFEITISDRSEPSKRNFLNIFGWKGMDFNEWKKEYEKSS